MNLLNRLFIFSVLVGLCSFDQAQDCKSLIKDYIKGLAKESLPEVGKVYNLHLRIETISKGEYATPVNEIRMTSDNERMVYETSYISYYQDKNEVFTVIHPQKLIVRSVPGEKEAKDLRTAQTAMLQDSLLEVCKLKSCKDGILDNHPVKIIELTTSAEGQKKFKVTRLVYYFNEKTNKLEREQIFYIPAATIEMQDIHFLEMGQSKGKNLPSAKDFVFDGKNLKSKFKGYKIEQQAKLTKK